MMRSLAYVIPARLASSRLPEKPLADIAGKPMVVRTWERTVAAAGDPEAVWVATDHERIAEACRAVGAQVVMTPETCLTGTDRLAAAAAAIDAAVYINVQGDEPLMPEEDIRRVAEAALAAPGQIVNGWCWIETEAEYRSRSVPKVVLREDGRLLYMSRAPVPGTKEDTFRFARRQVCVYAFPRAALAAFAAAPQKTPHESLEDIEILRFLEMGHEVVMIELSALSIAVDTPQDLDRVRALFDTPVP